MDVNWFSYCGNHFVVHAYINYLCCALKTNIICQLYITKIVCWRYQLNCTVTTKTCECPLRIPSLKTVCVLCHFSPVWLFVTPWTITLQAPLSMGFSRQKYWSGLPFPTPKRVHNSMQYFEMVLLFILYSSSCKSCPLGFFILKWTLLLSSDTH